MFMETNKRKNCNEFIKTPSQKCKILVMNVEAFSTKKGVNVALAFLQKHDAITAIDESSTIKNLRAKRTKNFKVKTMVSLS